MYRSLYEYVQVWIQYNKICYTKPDSFYHYDIRAYTCMIYNVTYINHTSMHMATGTAFGCSLRVLFRGLVRAFAGHLGVRELLALWDRVLVFDSLRPLALFAVAIFSFRQLNLLQVRTAAAAKVSPASDCYTNTLLYASPALSSGNTYKAVASGGQRGQPPPPPPTRYFCPFPPRTCTDSWLKTSLSTMILMHK